MQLAKLDNGQLITTYADDEDRELINLMVADGFKIYVEEQQLSLPFNPKNYTTGTRVFKLSDIMR